MVDFVLIPEKRGNFLSFLQDQVLPVLKNQPGFVDLVALVSDEHPDHALGLTLWETREAANRFYISAAPMLEVLKPLAAKPPTVEHFDVHTSLSQRTVATGKAA
jgi:heme-degrading monooxygenase HmoA